MRTADAEFEAIISTIVRRFQAQTGRAPGDADLPRFVAQLRQLVADHGLPPPLCTGDPGTPGGMAEDECAALVIRVMVGIAEPSLADLAKQLVKACFYPEFTVCRDSFREVARDGTCRRQEPQRARGRVSGAHCVDCPHWVGLGPADHAAFLAAEWRSDPQKLGLHRDIFLPEDFRALRLWLHVAARRPATEA